MKPWRAVTGARLRAGRGSLLGPDTARRARWWELELACGHRAERFVRYRSAPRPQRGGTQHRRGADVLPAPRRVRCEVCREPTAGRDAEGTRASGVPSASAPGGEQGQSRAQRPINP